MKFRLLFALLGTASTVAAQSPTDRRALGEWNDSLLTAANSGALARVASRSGGGSSVSGLRRLLLTLRQGELRQSRPDLELVLTNAEWIGNTHHDWPWCQYAMARAFAAMQFAGWTPLPTDDGKALPETFGDATWRHLREALDGDPNFLAARRMLVTLLVAGGDRVLRDDQRAALERQVQRPDPDPDALLVWARHLRTSRQYDSALTVFNRALVAGGDPSRLALERARTLRALHDSAGATTAYWYGLEHLTPIGREMYHYDLAWIISADSLAAFDRIRDGDVLRWMHRFWDERDAAAAHDAGTRLDEHLRRWVVAYARYRVLSPWRRTMYDRIDMFFDNDDCLHFDAALYELLWRTPPVHIGDIRAHEWLLDHRGIIYLRHGEPLQRIGGQGPRLDREDFVTGNPADQIDVSPVWSDWATGGHVRAFSVGPAPVKPGLTPYQTLPRSTESWLYLMDGQGRLLHFRNSYAIGMYDATTLASFLPYNPAEWVARSGTLPEYYAAAERIIKERNMPFPDPHPTCWNEVRVANAKSRADADVGTKTDTDSPPVLYPWESSIQIFALGDEHDANGEALITFALGGEWLRAEQADDGTTLYPIHFRVVAWEKNTGRTITIDTARGFAHDKPLAANERLVSWLNVPLPSGDWQIAVRAKQESDSSGAYAVRRSVRVDAGTTLGVSDVVTGIAGSATWRATDGADFPVNVMGSWPVGTAAELYYEVHGVPVDGVYRTTVEVRPIDVKLKQTVRITTTDRSLGSVTHVRRTLGLERLVPGNYQLIITVEAGSERATRTESLTVSKPLSSFPQSN